MSEVVDEAAAVLRRGGLVAFPTETVYGLGAAARDPEAVAKVFRAKGRPADHPLIVHVAHADAAPAGAARWDARAARLAERFWPGPLTLIVPKAGDVPGTVTGGQDTVGLRVPDHALARELLTAFGDGVAAPSANRFGAVSPTTAAHVALELADAVDLLLDGGPCRVGVESTIVDLSGERARLLRPGGVAAEAIEEVLGTRLASAAGAPRAPGTLASHYAPRAALELVAPGEEAAALDAAAAG
ncbi:MAG: L-threonylcarbamoyladenylate synthase, partial [Myxococcota bacterium]